MLIIITHCGGFVSVVRQGDDDLRCACRLLTKDGAVFLPSVRWKELAQRGASDVGGMLDRGVGPRKWLRFKP